MNKWVSTAKAHLPSLLFSASWVNVLPSPDPPIPPYSRLIQSFWRRKWQPTLVFLPGKSHGQRRLGGYSPWGWEELDISNNEFPALPPHPESVPPWLGACTSGEHWSVLWLPSPAHFFLFFFFFFFIMIYYRILTIVLYFIYRENLYLLITD